MAGILTYISIRKLCIREVFWVDWIPALPHALLMWKAFKHDTGLTDLQIKSIRFCYNQNKGLPLHGTLVEKAIVALEKQDNKALFPLFDQGFNELGPCYPLALIYSLYPSIIALYDRLAISESVRQATLSDIFIWVRVYEKYHSGITGLDRYGWICRHLCAKIFRLGRLQFEPGIFEFPYSIYYDSKLSQYRTFAQDGVKCTPDGYVDSSESPESGAWVTTCSINGDFLIAHEVDQDLGMISLEAVAVPIMHLELICTHDTSVVFVHIPVGEPLYPYLIDASFSEALKMFGPTLLVSSSWLLDPELTKILPIEGNICHFMNRFLKFPIAFSTPQIYERVFGFGATKADILVWECTTSLQAKVQSHIRNGGIFRTMGGYISNPAL